MYIETAGITNRITDPVNKMHNEEPMIATNRLYSVLNMLPIFKKVSDLFRG